MKKHKHTLLSNAECAHVKCGWVNGRGSQSTVRRLIKQNVVDRLGTNRPLECYPCQVYHKTGKIVQSKKDTKIMKAGR